MLVLAITATIRWLALVSQVSPNDPLSQQVLARVANPLLTSAQFLIPAAVAISGIHKMMEHRESTLAFRSLVNRDEHRHGSDRIGVAQHCGIQQHLLEKIDGRRNVESVNPGAHVDDGPARDCCNVEEGGY